MEAKGFEALRWKTLKYIAFLASSARILTEEPHLCGSFRLIDSISRLMEVLESIPNFTLGEPFSSIRRFVDEGKHSVMKSKEDYLKFLDELLDRVVKEAFKVLKHKGS